MKVCDSAKIAVMQSLSLYLAIPIVALDLLAFD